MASSSLPAFAPFVSPVFVVTVAFIFLTLLSLPFGSSPLLTNYDRPKPIIFNFGDSNSDTGGLVAGLGLRVALPNGRSFFHKSTGRLSDGRLVIDFLCESVNSSYVSPYMESLGSTFINGANFAVVGSSTLPNNLPFALHVQLLQFLHFKARSLQLVTSRPENFIDEQGFRNALYMIDIGQNDLADSFTRNLSYAQVIGKIPLVMTEIGNAIKAVYAEGGRRFWVHNTGPLGCLPQKLSVVHTGPQDHDQYGCISSYNSAAKHFNNELRGLCEELRSQMKDAIVVYVDIYAIKYDLIANSSKYGFSTPLMACCGYGGPPYNYDKRINCGNSGCQVCNEGSRFISWDGIHYSEAANWIIASKILSTAYSTPRVPFNFLKN